MKHAVVGRNDEFVGVERLRGIDDLRGRADRVGELDHLGGGFRVNEHLCPRMLFLQDLQLQRLEFFVHDACAVPQQHVGAGPALHVGPEVTVGRPQYLFPALVQVAHDVERDCGGDHPAGARLDRCARIRIDHHGALGVQVAETGEFIGRTTQIERAACVEVGHEHALLGIEDLRRLAHEAHARDHQRRRGLRPPETRHLERVRHAATGLFREILDIGLDVVVREQHRAALFEQASDARFQVAALLRAGRHRDLCPGPRCARNAGKLVLEFDDLGRLHGRWTVFSLPRCNGTAGDPAYQSLAGVRPER